MVRVAAGPRRSSVRPAHSGELRTAGVRLTRFRGARQVDPGEGGGFVGCWAARLGEPLEPPARGCGFTGQDPGWRWRPVHTEIFYPSQWGVVMAGDCNACQARHRWPP